MMKIEVKTEEFRETFLQREFLGFESHFKSPGIELGSPRRESSV
jgi:hypothetical protein